MSMEAKKIDISEKKNNKKENILAIRQTNVQFKKVL